MPANGFRQMRAESEARLDRVDSSDQTCLDIARELGVIGIAADLPEDLNTNPKYFEGSGETEPPARFSPPAPSRDSRARQHAVDNRQLPVYSMSG